MGSSAKAPALFARCAPTDLTRRPSPVRPSKISNARNARASDGRADGHGRSDGRSFGRSDGSADDRAHGSADGRSLGRAFINPDARAHGRADGAPHGRAVCCPYSGAHGDARTDPHGDLRADEDNGSAILRADQRYVRAVDVADGHSLCGNQN